MTTAHKFVSAVADGADATLVRPSNWNADHDGIQDQAAEPAVDQVVRAGYSAHLVGLPLLVDSGRLVEVQAGGVLVIDP